MWFFIRLRIILFKQKGEVLWEFVPAIVLGYWLYGVASVYRHDLLKEIGESFLAFFVVVPDHITALIDP